MVMVKLKGLHKVKVRSNSAWYYYAWRGGPRIYAPFGTPEFFAEWDSLTANTYQGDKRKFGTWVELYRRSEEFKALAQSTRDNWIPWLDKVEKEFGELSIAQFDRPQVRPVIRKWRDQWRDRPRTADYAKQVLSRVLSFAVADGQLRLNPCPGIPNLYHSDRSDRIWTDDDLKRFLKHASPQVSWVVRLAAMTGFRQGDLLRLCWGHVRAHDIEYRTGKSRGRRRAIAPLTQDAKDLLASIPKRNARILTNSDGEPWRGFSSSWRETLIKAKMQDRDLHFHDLRGTAATNLYRAGFTIREIAETLGWSEDKVEKLIDLYIKRDEIMADRARRLELLQKRESGNENNGR